MPATDLRTRRVIDHRFYSAISIVFALVVFAGFAHTYYLKGAFGAPALHLPVHIHGAVMTLWYVLFIVQVRLVATHRVALHRTLGVSGIFLAGLVVVMTRRGLDRPGKARIGGSSGIDGPARTAGPATDRARWNLRDL